MKISKMESIPPDSNPFHYDLDRQGAQINERFMAMFHSAYPNELIIVDLKTGTRTKLQFPAVGSKKELTADTGVEDRVTIFGKDR